MDLVDEIIELTLAQAGPVTDLAVYRRHLAKQSARQLVQLHSFLLDDQARSSRAWRDSRHEPSKRMDAVA